MKNLANFLFEVGMLKRTPRSGFQFLGSGAQSVAEHSFRTAMIGYTLAQLSEGVDCGRVVMLCLFHDVPEARIGDLNYVNKKYVQADEQKAIDDLAATLPFGEQYKQTLGEFVDKETPEACLAHDADQLEMILALKEYKDLGNRYADEWYPFAVRRLQTDVARELAEAIWTTDSSRWWFDDNSDWWVHGKNAKGVDDSGQKC
ncbi:HD domain-containing protein [Desulfuromonas acetoxidans]|uniref:5'-deoxynucleotidase n=1 Tax=Desulfuromonas acetoxidans (strain DSM 684 / 11070) TaxID=281689 RepID=Q1K3X2_DESA6|nr:HD domain-containing protein [Desulfuromonas acetoxidans]EAT17331.1 metal dependent phosphohydrolase [Desulfuromonas acetoxidans DSM 684]MBF0644286.1 HD domain-containing protein [Desulfuromonas acetoxidans]NVD24844.1 HD domain-containing protein [Desulfuromonas acetoxidans]NVE15145.1 HD domain-containing protein [Desulfuromonas acetoxidans]